MFNWQSRRLHPNSGRWRRRTLVLLFGLALPVFCVKAAGQGVATRETARTATPETANSSGSAVPPLPAAAQPNRYKIVQNTYVAQAGVLVLDTLTQDFYWAYCIDPRLQWPFTGMGTDQAETADNLPDDLAGAKDALARLLYAGYPGDALGLSALDDSPYATGYGWLTQQVVWAILYPDADSGAHNIANLAMYPYAMALYAYAETGTLTGPYAPYLANAQIPPVLTSDTMRLQIPPVGRRSAGFTLAASRNMLVEVQNVPAGCVLYADGEERTAGTVITVPPEGKKLTLECGAAAAPTGSLTFRAAEGIAAMSLSDLRLFVLPDPAYQRMIGYAAPAAESALTVAYQVAAPTPVPTTSPAASPLPTATPGNAPTATPLQTAAATAVVPPTRVPHPTPAVTPLQTAAATAVVPPTRVPHPTPAATPLQTAAAAAVRPNRLVPIASAPAPTAAPAAARASAAPPSGGESGPNRVPQTGDRADPARWRILLGLALSGMAILRRKAARPARGRKK